MQDSTPDSLRGRYRPLLVEELATLRAASASSSGDRRPVTLDQQSVGRLSRMDAMQQQAMAAAQEARRRGRIATLQAALSRIEGEGFGFCEDCGEVIGWRRLDLDPALRRCIACAR